MIAARAVTARRDPVCNLAGMTAFVMV